MTTRFTLDRTHNLLYFPHFTQPIPYEEQDPTDNSPFVHYHTTMDQTGELLDLRIKHTVLQQIGISASAWEIASHQQSQLLQLIQHTSIVDDRLQKAAPLVAQHLSPRYLTFFQNRSHANSVLNFAIQSHRQHCCKVPEVPGFYISASQDYTHIFINLKKTKIGSGAWGKIKKALWLTAPGGAPTIIAKKVIANPRTNKKAEIEALQNEISSLKEFQNKRGIISMICGQFFDDKLALFLPLYDMNLNTFCKKPSRGMDTLLSIASQLLEGLATIAEKGIHGDLSATNILIKEEEDGNFKAAIADYGTYCPLIKEAKKCCTERIRSPEYYSRAFITDKHDVWGLALCLHKLFAQTSPLHEVKDMEKWLLRLFPNWILLYPITSAAPPFLMNLFNDMLHPNYHTRISAKQAYERFTAELAEHMNESKMPPNPIQSSEQLSILLPSPSIPSPKVNHSYTASKKKPSKYCSTLL